LPVACCRSVLKIARGDFKLGVLGLLFSFMMQFLLIPLFCHILFALTSGFLDRNYR